MKKALSGKKTYIGTIALGILGLLFSWSGQATESLSDDVVWLAWLTPQVFGTLVAAVGTFTGVSLRSGVAKR